MRRAMYLTILAAFALVASGCSPEVGSKKWCAQMKEKPKGEWTVNEAKQYAKHCIF